MSKGGNNQPATKGEKEKRRRKGKDGTDRTDSEKTQPERSE